MLRSVFEVKGRDELKEAMLSLGSNFPYGAYQKIIHLISEEGGAHQPVYDGREAITVKVRMTLENQRYIS